MRHVFSKRIGPAGFRIGSAWGGPIRQLEHLYAGYPELDGGIADFTVRLEPETRLRRFIRPSVRIDGDLTLPEAAPMSLAHGLLAAEMGMNLHMALGQRRFLLLHASAVERDGKAVIMTGESGAGKSTLSALLGERGWRFMGDEFVLVEPATGMVHAFPRLVSLKNEAIDAMRTLGVAEDRFGPLLKGTPKGSIRHMVPNAEAVARMDEPARPVLILYPRFGHASDERPVGLDESFVRLTQASTNYVALGEAGFEALVKLVKMLPSIAIDYPDGEAAATHVERLWEAHA